MSLLLTLLSAAAGFGGDDPVEVRLAVLPERAVEVELRADFGPAAGRSLSPALGVVGGYEAVDWRPYFEGLSAWNAAGEELAIVEDGVRGWVLSGEGELARVAYRVDVGRQERELADAGISSRVRPDYAFLNGYGLFLSVGGAEARAQVLELTVPAGWRVATGLPSVGPARWLARSSLELMDEPWMLGQDFSSVQLEPGDPGRRLHLHVEGELEEAPVLALLEGAAADAAAAIRALDLPSSPAGYQFFFELFAAEGEVQLGWAIERGRSMHGVGGARAAQVPPFRAAYHLAHHELHAWMPRRLYTASLHPRRMARAERSEFVWFAEGFPQYLAFCGLGKSGRYEPELVLEGLAKRFAGSYVDDAPAEPVSMRALSSELSVGAREHWFHGFSAGALLAMWIDQDMRRADPERGLLEALRAMDAAWSEHPEGIPDARLVTVLSEHTGLDLAPRFERHVDDDDPLPLAEILAGAGIVGEPDGLRVLADDEVSERVRRFRAGAFGP